MRRSTSSARTACCPSFAASCSARWRMTERGLDATRLHSEGQASGLAGVSASSVAGVPAEEERRRRWRMVLGGDDADGIGSPIDGTWQAMDEALSALYETEDSPLM